MYICLDHSYPIQFISYSVLNPIHFLIYMCLPTPICTITIIPTNILPLIQIPIFTINIMLNMNMCRIGITEVRKMIAVE